MGLISFFLFRQISTSTITDRLFFFSFSLADKSASKIQAAFRKHQARLKLKKQAAWQIHEKLEYCSEQTEAKVSICSSHFQANAFCSSCPIAQRYVRKITQILGFTFTFGHQIAS